MKTLTPTGLNPELNLGDGEWTLRHPCSQSTASVKTESCYADWDSFGPAPYCPSRAHAEPAQVTSREDDLPVPNVAVADTDYLQLFGWWTKVGQGWRRSLPDLLWWSIFGGLE